MLVFILSSVTLHYKNTDTSRLMDKAVQKRLRYFKKKAPMHIMNSKKMLFLINRGHKLGFDSLAKFMDVNTIMQGEIYMLDGLDIESGTIYSMIWGGSWFCSFKIIDETYELTNVQILSKENTLEKYFPFSEKEILALFVSEDFQSLQAKSNNPPEPLYGGLAVFGSILTVKDMRLKEIKSIHFDEF